MVIVRDYDLVIFGGSGFTGRYVIEEVARTVGEEGHIWAVAGRSRAKLRKALEDAAKVTGEDLRSIDIMTADIDDDTSIEDMCKRTKVLLNCVGPYRFYGEKVVKACVKHGTHHLDISGEIGFLDKMYLKYNTEAEKTNSYIVGSCGFDAVPADMGVIFTRDAFKGDLSWVESYVAIDYGNQGTSLNFGTFNSAVYCGTNFLSDIRQHWKVLGGTLPKHPHKMPWRWPLFQRFNSWCIPNPGDWSIVDRTQKYNHEVRQERPVQFNTYFRLPSIVAVFYLMVVGVILVFFSQFKFGRRLLQNHPKIMTGGLFSKHGPTRKQVEEASFSMIMEGCGHREKNNVNEMHNTLPDKKITVKITGPELAYITTPICLVQCAYILLSQSENIPNRGGVYTPAAVFGKSSLVQRLQSRGINFIVVKQDS